MTRYIGLFELVAAIRAAVKPTPTPVMEPARIELTAEQFASVDETAGIES
jgi:hypothetical protein